MAGAVEVVDAEGVGCGVHHRGEAVSVDVVAGNDVAGVGFGQQVSGGIVDVFRDHAVARGLAAVAPELSILFISIPCWAFFVFHSLLLVAP